MRGAELLLVECLPQSATLHHAGAGMGRERRLEDRGYANLQRLERFLVLAVGAGVLEGQHRDHGPGLLRLQRQGRGRDRTQSYPRNRPSHLAPSHSEKPPPSSRRLHHQLRRHVASVLAGVRHQLVHHRIVVLRLVVKQDQPGALGLGREVDGLARGGVPQPARC